MEKLIIENRTSLPMDNILQYVAVVIFAGKISGDDMHKQYCYHTSFDGGIEVSAYRNKCSDRIIVSTY